MGSGARSGFGLTDLCTYLRLGSHVPPGAAGTTFTHQSICNALTPIPPPIRVFKTQDLMLLPPLLFQPLLFAIQAYAFHPHLGQARSLPRDSSLINPACMLIDLPICNSLLSQQEQSFSRNTTTGYPSLDWQQTWHAQWGTLDRASPAHSHLDAERILAWRLGPQACGNRGRPTCACQVLGLVHPCPTPTRQVLHLAGEYRGSLCREECDMK